MKRKPGPKRKPKHLQRVHTHCTLDPLSYQRLGELMKRLGLSQGRAIDYLLSKGL